MFTTAEDVKGFQRLPPKQTTARIQYGFLVHKASKRESLEPSAKASSQTLV